MQKLKLKKDLPGYKAGDVFFKDDDGWRGRLKNTTPYITNWMFQLLEQNCNDSDWFEELSIEPELPQSWEELGKIEGYWIDEESKVLSVTPPIDTEGWHENLFKTRKQAESALAYAQLTQLMAVYNDGWDPDWSDGGQPKYTIKRAKDYIEIFRTDHEFCFLAFEDRETAKKFLKAPKINKLIKHFYMMEVGDEN